MYVALVPAVGGSAAVQTGNVNSKEITVWDKFRSAHIVIDHPNIGGGITVTAYGKDRTSGFSYSLLSTNIVASGHTVMRIGSDLTAGANIAKDYIPHCFYVGVVASGTNAYSIGASLI